MLRLLEIRLKMQISQYLFVLKCLTQTCQTVAGMRIPLFKCSMTRLIMKNYLIRIVYHTKTTVENIYGL